MQHPSSTPFRDIEAALASLDDVARWVALEGYPHFNPKDAHRLLQDARFLALRAWRAILTAYPHVPQGQRFDCVHEGGAYEIEVLTNPDDRGMQTVRVLAKGIPDEERVVSMVQVRSWFTATN